MQRNGPRRPLLFAVSAYFLTDTLHRSINIEKEERSEQLGVPVTGQRRKRERGPVTVARTTDLCLYPLFFSSPAATSAYRKLARIKMPLIADNSGR